MPDNEYAPRSMRTRTLNPKLANQTQAQLSVACAKSAVQAAAVKLWNWAATGQTNTKWLSMWLSNATSRQSSAYLNMPT
jgi:hypothetical protein